MADALRWGNVPVPYTAMWSNEAEKRAPGIVRETWCGQRLAMLCEGIDDPTGKPLFKKLHADRCRHVIRHGLCQMCVRPLPDEVVCVNQGQQDAYRPLLSDGLPMCPGCAADALRACPGMQRQAAAGVLRIWRARRGEWLVAPVVLGAVPVSAGGDERINRLLRNVPHRVFTGPKLVLTAWGSISPAELDVAHA